MIHTQFAAGSVRSRVEDAEPDERSSRDPGSAASPAADQPGYAQALDELDQILRELEGSDVDVDRLADRVARASELIAVCRQRISVAKMRIDEVIADLDGGSDDEPDV